MDYNVGVRAVVIGMIVHTHPDGVVPGAMGILPSVSDRDVIGPIVLRREESPRPIGNETTPILLAQHLLALFVHDLQDAGIDQTGSPRRACPYVVLDNCILLSISMM